MAAPNIVVGPVIGKVTQDSVRILVETDRDATVTCSLSPSSGASQNQALALVAGRPGAFAFAGLQADTRYDVRFEGATCLYQLPDQKPQPLPSRFRTLAATPASLNLAAVSCNFTIKREDTDLWADLWEKYVLPGEVDLLLHLGDQVYGDSAFEQAMGELAGRRQGTARQEETILEMYRRLYRLTWGYPPTRRVLANVPSLMIWDDHEIRDDWGSRPGDWDSTTPEHFIGTLARRVYREYQRQLWDDHFVAEPPVGQLEEHWHRWGEVGVLFVDQRGGRAFQRDPARPYLGLEQWSRIGQTLDTGELSKVRALIVVTSVPLVYLGDSISSAGDEIVDDLRDHWAFGPHQKEQVEMLRKLRMWKQASPNRELLVLGGDVHLGCMTDIKHEGAVIFKQLITSPITQKPVGWLEFQALKALLETEEKLGASYGFEHQDYTRKRNYGIVTVRLSAGEAPRVQGSLERAV